MTHSSDQHHQVSGKNLLLTILLNIIITLAQVIGGLLSGSISLLSDALHNFSDVMALVIAWWANKIATKDKNSQKTYGYKRAQIVAALFNGAVLTGLGLFLIIEAVNRFINTQSIASDIVIGLAALSIVLNAMSVLLIKSHSHHNLNIKAAYLHLMSDVMTSIAVLVGGLMMKFYQWYWLDPVITIFIAIYLILTSFNLIQEAIAILMQSSPKSVDIHDIESLAEHYPELKNIHHIHLWQLDDSNLILDAHLDFNEDLSISESAKFKQKLEKELLQKFSISHVTLQAEYNVNDDKDVICTH